MKLYAAMLAVAMTMSSVAFGGSIPSDFEIQKFTVKDHKDHRGAWVKRSSVVQKKVFYVVVGASWCHFTVALLKGMVADKKLSTKIDLVLIFDDEIPVVTDLAKKEYGNDKGEEIGRKLRKLGRRLFSPDDVNVGLPLYLVKASTVDKVVGGFPSVLKCTEDNCAPATDEIIDAINPILLEESRRSQ